MIPKGPGFRAIISINVTMLCALLFAVLAVWLWPDTAAGWREGSMAILCGYSAIVLTISGLGRIRQHLSRDVPVRRFERRTRKARSDTMAGDDSLRKAGMLD